MASPEMLPKPLAHKNYIMGSNATFCRYITHLPHEEICEFTREEESCRELVLYFNYLDIIFCRMPDHEYVHVVALLILAVLGIFSIVVIVCNSMLNTAPNIISLTRYLRMEEYTAGALLIAIIGGLPGAVVRFFQTDSDTELMYNEILGGNIFMVGFSFGFQAVLYPFKIHGPFFLRDTIFLLLIHIILMTKLESMKLYLWEALFYMSFYALYILLITLHYFVARIKYKGKKVEVHAVTGEVMAKKLSQEGLKSPFKRFHVRFEISEESQFEAGSNERNKNLLRQFCISVNPFRDSEPKTKGKIAKYFLMIFFPVRFILSLLVPVVDYRVPLHDWSKLLNCINIFMLPTFVTLFVTDDLRVLVSVFGVTFVLAIITFFITRTNEPPKFHILFAIVGLLGSSAISYIIISEFLTILHTLGTVLGFKRSILGLTLLAWGKSVGDVVLCLILAHMGYYKMASGAYYGAAVYDTLLGFGVSFAMRCSGKNNPCLNVRKGDVGSTTEIFLLIQLIFSVLAISMTGFQVRKSIGYLLIIIYVIFFIFLLLIQTEIIHSYGSDHHGFKNLGVVWA